MRNLSGFHRAAVILLSAAAVASLCRAVETHVWQQDEVDEFNRGTVKNLAIRSDGHVTLSPAFRELADPGVPYLWSMVQDAQGTIYCAGGAHTVSTAKIIAISRDGKSRTLGTLNALEIHARALDKKGRLYAATSPDSKIYRIEANGKTDLFFDPHAKYVWALAFDNADNLYVATGDQGVVYRVSPDGHGAEFLRTEESHARSMIIDSKGDLIIGTEPGGTVLRVHPNGKSFVLFQTGKREVTAVAEHDGYIYAAAAAGKAPVLALPVAPTTPAAGTGKAQFAFEHGNAVKAFARGLEAAAGLAAVLQFRQFGDGAA